MADAIVSTADGRIKVVVNGDGLLQPYLTAAASSAAAAATSAGAAAGSATSAATSAAIAQDVLDDVGGVAGITSAVNQANSSAASALIYKTNAETAQAGAQSAETDAIDSAADAATERAAAVVARLAAEAAAASAGPVTAITQAAVYDLGGSTNINGTGTPLPNSDHNVAIAPRTAVGVEALYGANALNTRKAVAIGSYAMQYFNGYDSTGINWRAGYYTTANYAVSIAVHSGEATNMETREVTGFGTRASGTVTFTGLPSADDTITLNAVTFTAKASAATATEFTIGGTVSATIDNLLAKIVGNTAAGLKGYLFRKSTSGTVLEILAIGAGAWGNGFTLAVSGAGLAISGATLSGGATTANAGDPNLYTGMVAVGVAAVKRFDPSYARAPYGVILVTGQASVGATITLGLPTGTPSGTAATAKRFTCVASGATGLQFNQGADAAAQIVNIVSAIQAYVAANPTHTATNSVEFYASTRGVEIVHKTASDVGNVYRTECTGTNLSAPFPYLHGGYTASTVAPIGIGQNIEAGLGMNIVAVGSQAMRGGQGSNVIAIGANSGNFSVGQNNIYLNGSGQSVIGSFNMLFGNNQGGAAVQGYMAVASVSSTGLITLAAPMTDIQAVVGRRFTVYQRNSISGTNLIKLNGSNITNPGMRCKVDSPTTLQIIDFTDGTGPTGDGVYSVTGTVTDIEVALFDAVLNFATSWGDAPESFTFHIGQARQQRATVQAQRLEIPNGRWQMAATASGSAAHAAGYVNFPTANGNFAADETVTVNGVVFTAKAAATFATPNASMIRWFRIGADMFDSLNNLCACIRNSDDDSANARLVRIATYFATSVSGAWRFNARVTGRLATGNSFTLASSKTGATVTGPTGGSVGTVLPVAATNVLPAVIDGERRMTTLGGELVDVMYSSALDDYVRI